MSDFFSIMQPLWVDIKFLYNVTFWPKSWTISFHALHNFTRFLFPGEVGSLCICPPISVSCVTSEEQSTNFSRQIMEVPRSGAYFGVGKRTADKWVLGPFAVKYTWKLRITEKKKSLTCYID